jgi:hypothetical protein
MLSQVSGRSDGSRVETASSELMRQGDALLRHLTHSCVITRQPSAASERRTGTPDAGGEHTFELMSASDRFC